MKLPSNSINASIGVLSHQVLCSSLTIYDEWLFSFGGGLCPHILPVWNQALSKAQVYFLKINNKKNPPPKPKIKLQRMK